RDRQFIRIDEAGAGLTEALGRLLFAEAIDRDALFADACGQPGEVAVRRHQAEAVEPSRMQQVHRVDDQGDVARVLALGVLEVLLPLDRPARQDVDPALQRWVGRIAVDAPGRGLAQGGDLAKKRLGDPGRGVLAVDQHGQARGAGGRDQGVGRHGGSGEGRGRGRLALPALRVNRKAKRPAGRPAGRLVQVWIEAAYWAGLGASAARTSTGRPRASSCGLTTAASPTTTQTKLSGLIAARAAASICSAVRALMRPASVS